MDIGIYQFKNHFREYLVKLLPFAKDIDPNWITLSVVPLGLLTAWIYACAAEHTWLYFIGFLFLLLRMVVTTVDGMAAEHYGKTSTTGTLLNRICPEFADISLLAALALSAGENSDIAIWACAIGWASSYLGLIGMAVGRSIVSIGPVGQTDRVLALIVASIISLLMGPETGMQLFFWWCIFGGFVTCALRLQKILQVQTEA